MTFAAPAVKFTRRSLATPPGAMQACHSTGRGPGRTRLRFPNSSSRQIGVPWHRGTPSTWWQARQDFRCLFASSAGRVPGTSSECRLRKIRKIVVVQDASDRDFQSH